MILRSCFLALRLDFKFRLMVRAGARARARFTNGLMAGYTVGFGSGEHVYCRLELN